MFSSNYIGFRLFSQEVEALIGKGGCASHDGFLTMSRRWDLPLKAYFQLQAAHIGDSCAGMVTATGEADNWDASVGESVCANLEWMWQSGVCLRPLAPRFLRLTLQVVVH